MFLEKYRNRLRDAADFFSIRLLVQNLFAPFRQISAVATANSSLGARISMFFDRLLSRVIGAVVRFLLLIFGLIILLIQAVAGLITLILWPLAPFLIIICVVLTIMRVKF